MSRELIEPVEFFKIDKISDEVYNIGPNVVLKFNVSLSKVSNNKRYHFHKEYEYSAKNIDGQQSLVTIKRNFDYYLSIENIQKDSNGNKVFIRIGPQEYMIFKKSLDEAIAWFTDKKYAKLFVRDKGRLILMSPTPEFKIHNLPMQKYIEIFPIIIDRGMSNSDKEPGVRMILGNSSSYVDINVDRLMGLYYTISTFNMYQTAVIVLNYLQRPEFGTNRVVMESSFSPNKERRRANDNIDGRYVTPRLDEKLE